MLRKLIPITRRVSIPALAVVCSVETNGFVLGGNDGLQLAELEADDCGMLAIGFGTRLLGSTVVRLDERDSP